MANGRKLGSLLINPRFQISVIVWFTSVAAVVIATFFVAFVRFFKDLRAQGESAGLAADHPLFQYISLQEAHFFEMFAVVALIAVVTIVAGGLWLSHRVAGPLHRLTQHLRNASPANVENVRFRDRDYFPEVQEAFNGFVSRRK